VGFYEKYLCLCNSINKSPSAVALELKIGKPSVTRWKNGASPRDATVLKIADYFGVTVTELMAGVGEQEKAPATEGEGSKEAASNFIKATNDRAALLALINEATKKLQELE
jgi:transcriptional regulator with XRE-family HTH domain